MKEFKEYKELQEFKEDIAGGLDPAFVPKRFCLEKVDQLLCGLPLNSLLIRFDGPIDLSGSLGNEKSRNRVSPLRVMSSASVSLDRLFIAIELE